ncbi:hypothetical protein MACJ_004028 [Theileria orientalis]|uniref:Uncharacterized protein n=1 Tax=Theileria orientalis TaxID=68886 RepID=A0A976SKW7_THEOR|nr:hypothetical protein MACJ_004028 [Theileria orientalis]
MLNAYILLLLISFKQGSPDLARLKLDLTSESAKDFTKNYMEFDNATYVVYKGLNGAEIEEVTDGNQVVWTESQERCKAKAVIVAYDNATPTLLYVYTPVYTFYKYYFARVDGRWVKTTYEWYSYKLESIKTKITHDFKMDVGFTKASNKFMYYPQSPSKPYETFIPFNGYAAKTVNYSASALWTAKSELERAVAVWIYKHRASHYLVRILVFDGHENYTFRDFIRLRSLWVNMDHTPLTLKPSHKYPDDILFPEYLILKAEREGLSSESKSSAQSEDSTTGAPSNYDYEYHNKPISPCKCRKLDFSKSVPPLVGRKETSVFAKYLNVESYFPVPGNFFGVVSDGHDTIYQRNIDIEACIGVHFYTRDDKVYLADVLVTSPKKPRSEYHVKVNGRWSPVSSNRFFTLLDELTTQQRLIAQTQLSNS